MTLPKVDITPEGFFKVQITEEMRRWADQESAKDTKAFGKLTVGSYKKSIKDRVVAGVEGKLGEAAFFCCYRMCEKIKVGGDYDFLHNGKRIDVKTARMKEKFLPNKKWHTMLMLDDKKKGVDEKKVDVFVFAFLQNEFAWIIGWNTRDEIGDYACFVEKGKPTATGNIVHEDSYAVPLEKMQLPRLLWDFGFAYGR